MPRPHPHKPVHRSAAPSAGSSGGNQNMLYGLHAVRAALLNPARKSRKLLVTESGLESLSGTLEEARKRALSIPAPEVVDKVVLEKRLPPGAVHQGVALEASSLPDVEIEDLCRMAATHDSACVVVLDQVTDPHNVGAILRSAAAFDALAVVVQKLNAPDITGTLAKSACGAAELTPLVRVTNISRALDELKQAGFWTVGLDERGRDVLSALNLSGKTALVLGAEGEGLRRLTAEHCDLLARLPTTEAMPSLNVSNAAAVALYEIRRK